MSFLYDESEKLRLENKLLNASYEYCANQSKKFENETKVLKEEVQILKKSKEGLLKQITDLTLDKEKKETEEKNLKLIEKVSELQQVIESERNQASKKDSDFLKLIEEKKDLEFKCADLNQKISELEKIICATKIDLKEKKSLEFRCISLYHQVTDLEKLLFQEKETQEKERKASEEMKKKAEMKYSTVFKELSDQRKAVEQSFEEERELFKIEIKKLTKQLADLSTAAMRDGIVKSELIKKIDHLSTERNSLSSKISDLVESVYKTPSEVKKTPSEVDSFKTAPSSSQSTVSYKRSNSSPFIRSSNIFFDKNVDRSGTYKSSLPHEKFVWKKKDKYEWKKKEKDQKTVMPTFNVKKNNASNGKFLGKSKLTYTRDKMLSLSRRKFYCSYCHIHSFHHKSSDHFWYYSYSISPTRTATNISGPKYQWVPKSKPDSVLQAPHFKGK